MLPITWIDAVTQGIAGPVYLIVGLSAWRRSPGDERTRVFLGLTLANLVRFEVPAAAWFAGIVDITALLTPVAFAAGTARLIDSEAAPAPDAHRA